MSVLARAIERKQWELAAYVLLIALAQLAERIPEEGPGRAGAPGGGGAA